METETIFIQSTIQERLDKWLYLQYPEYSRTYFQYLIENKCVLVNGEVCKKRYYPEIGDEIEICFSITPELSLEPENIPLTILFEDDELLIVNKPAGMVVHPAPGHLKHTFVNALLYHCKSLEQTDSVRPGIVHRLDKDTSGVLIAAKTARAHRSLVSLLSSRSIRKTYLALCLGKPLQTLVDAPIKRDPVKRQQMAVLPEGKPALTKIHIRNFCPQVSYLEIDLITGRTHQIRVHLKHIGCPILGDPVYGNLSMNKKYQVHRQLLHASSIEFHHPFTNELLQIKTSIPQDMKEMVQKFFPDEMLFS